MKILHLIAEMDPVKGGVGQAVRILVRSFANKSVENEVVSLDSPEASFLSKETAVIHATGPGKSPWCYSVYLRRWLNENLSRFDVVIVHGLWLYNGYAVRKVWLNCINKSRTENKDKFVPQLYVMPHGMLDPYFQKAKGRKLKALRNWVFWKLIERKLVNAADGILFTCLAELHLARQPFRPYKPKNEIVVGLGIEDPPLFRPEMRTAFLEHCSGVFERPYLLFLSRLHEKKGVDILVNVYRDLLAAGVNLPILVVAGPGLESTFGMRLKKNTAEAGLASHIQFTGMLTGDSKWGAFHGCEAFILPSHQENFGIAVVEAIACSKPVLLSNQVNIWKEINNANAGLVEDDTVEGVKKLLQSWMGLSYNQKSQMGENARNCFTRNFAATPVAEHFLDVFYSAKTKLRTR